MVLSRQRTSAPSRNSRQDLYGPKPYASAIGLRGLNGRLFKHALQRALNGPQLPALICVVRICGIVLKSLELAARIERATEGLQNLCATFAPRQLGWGAQRLRFCAVTRTTFSVLPWPTEDSRALPSAPWSNAPPVGGPHSGCRRQRTGEESNLYYLFWRQVCSHYHYRCTNSYLSTRGAG